MFDWLNLTWTTSSGVGLRIANYNEWIIYNEIFVDGEYDAAIDVALAHRAPDRPLRVLDLGANVGFFTLRVFDRLRASGGNDAACLVTLVEANPESVAILRARLHDDNPFNARVRIVSALAGEPTGTATFYPSVDSPGDSSLVRRAGRGIVVPYVDLDQFLEDAPAVDLLKCDIEGAELAVIEQYPQLLARTRVAVFEFHHDRCPVDRCRDLLSAAGLTEETVLRDRGGCSLRLYRR